MPNDAVAKTVGGTPREFAEGRYAKSVEALDKIRSRTDSTAKIFAAVATAGLTAVGLTKAPDLFPLPAVWWAGLVLAATVAGFLLLAVAAALFVSQLWNVSRPIFTSSRLCEMRHKLDAEDAKNGPAEFALLEEAYRDTASLNEHDARFPDERRDAGTAFDLEAYEKRGFELQRRADAATEADDRTRLIEEAAVVRAEVLATQARASALIGRRRAAQAATSGRTALSIALFLIGLVVFAGGTDLLASERTDARIALSKSCADTLKVLREAKTSIVLPPLCDATSLPDPTPSAPHAGRERATTLVAMATQLENCMSRAEAAAAQDACRPTLELVRAAAGAPGTP